MPSELLSLELRLASGQALLLLEALELPYCLQTPARELGHVTSQTQHISERQASRRILRRGAPTHDCTII
jgi:hypothetical protein